MFTIFDIKDSYPSIKESLLKSAVQFAAEHTNINKNDFEVIFIHESLCYSILINLGLNKAVILLTKQWKRMMALKFAYDGAEICELVEIFILSLVSKKYSSSNIDLYRDG